MDLNAVLASRSVQELIWEQRTGTGRPTVAICNQLTYLLNVSDMETVLTNVSEINAMSDKEDWKIKLSSFNRSQKRLER